MIDATDAAIELAEENGIELALIKGTGSNGRILKGDVEAYMDQLVDVGSAESDGSDLVVPDSAVMVVETEPIDTTLEEIKNASSLNALHRIVARIPHDDYSDLYKKEVRHRAEQMLKEKFG